MKYHLKEKNKPMYLELYEQIRKDIVNKVYPFGSKLPSKRTVAEDVGVSIITVEHAYALLIEEGYVESRERSGFFVVFNTGDMYLEEDYTREERPLYHNEKIIGEFPFSVLAKAMRKVIADYGENLLEKTDNLGDLSFRQAIKKYLIRNRGIDADVNQIVIGSGAEYLYGLLTSLFERNKIFGIENPSYEKIEKVYVASGVKIEKLPLDATGVASSALAKTKADVLHISPYKSYPTGITADASKRHEYVTWAGKGNRFIIEDDFQSEFSLLNKAEDTIFSLSDNDNVIYMNTFSKTISSSLRVGYMVLPKCLVEPFNEKLGFYSCTVPAFEQFLIKELLNNGDFERHINRVRRQKRSLGQI